MGYRCVFPLQGRNLVVTLLLGLGKYFHLEAALVKHLVTVCTFSSLDEFYACFNNAVAMDTEA